MYLYGYVLAQTDIAQYSPCISSYVGGKWVCIFIVVVTYNIAQIYNHNELDFKIHVTTRST